MTNTEHTIRYWIDKEINKLNEHRQDYLSKCHKLEGAFEYFSYIKDMTGYKLTYNEGSEIGSHFTAIAFLNYLEYVNNTINAIKENK